MAAPPLPGPPQAQTSRANPERWGWDSKLLRLLAWERPYGSVRRLALTHVMCEVGESKS
jgi:hypothetical protein